MNSSGIFHDPPTPRGPDEVVYHCLANHDHDDWHTLGLWLKVPVNENWKPGPQYGPWILLIAENPGLRYEEMYGEFEEVHGEFEDYESTAERGT